MSEAIRVEHPAPERVNAFEAGEFVETSGVLPYRIFAPAGAAGPVPLVLFLHGAYERGADNRRQLELQTAPMVFSCVEVQRRYPCFMVAPQCPEGQQWVDMPWGEFRGVQPPEPTWALAASVALIRHLLASERRIDPARVVVTGFSMGGYGAWDAIIRWPELFRAAVPICGGGDEGTVLGIKDKPVWAFHAEDDDVVPVVRSRKMIEAMRAVGGSPRYTEYPSCEEVGHGAWNRAYVQTPGIFPFLLG